jgi:hypothetical protein
VLSCAGRRIDVVVRRISIAALLTAGTLLAVGACLGIWTQRQALDTDQWTETSTRLLEDEPIRTALGLFLVDRLYRTDPVEDQLERVLPPRLDPLAAPAAAALKQAAERSAPRLLGSAVAIRAWRDANREAHAELLKAVDDERDGVRIDLAELVDQLAGDAGLPRRLIEALPPGVGQLEVLPPDELQTAREIVDALDTLPWLLTALSLLAFAGAVALSGDRRRTLVSVGGCLVLAGVAALAVRRVGGNVVVDAIAQSPNGEEAARDAWSIATSLLVDSALGTLLLGLIVASGAWLGGPGRRASWLRRHAGPTLRDDPGIARVALGLALLLLVLWAPVPWTGRFVPMLVLTITAFAWLEWLRRRAVADDATAAAAG